MPTEPIIVTEELEPTVVERDSPGVEQVYCIRIRDVPFLCTCTSNTFVHPADQPEVYECTDCGLRYANK